MEPTLEHSPEQREAEIFNLKGEISSTLRLAPEDLSLVNPNEFLEGGARYLYATTEEGFIKTAEKEGEKKLLQREAAGTTIAHEIGLPCVDVLTPFQETEKQKGVLQLEKLNLEDGQVLTSNEQVADLNPEVGQRYGELFTKAVAREIPPNIDTNGIDSNHWKNSLETFRTEWANRYQTVLDPNHDSVRDELIPREKLEALLADFHTNLDPLLDASETPEQKFFCHNDLGPSQIFLRNDTNQEESEIILDYEYAGYTNNQTLARLTELGNFYGRLWTNPELQQQFLVSYLEHSNTEELDNNYHLLRGVAVHGVTTLAKFAMDPEHPEHLMARSLLGTLDGNIHALEEEYQRMSQASNELVSEQELNQSINQ